MEKQQRRDRFTQKLQHQKKQKESRKQEVGINGALKDKIKSLDLKGIVDFMTNEYEVLVRKAPQNESLINGQVIKRIEVFKSAWKAYHHQRLINYLKKYALPLPKDPKLTLSEKFAGLYQKGQYYTYRQNINRMNLNKVALQYVTINFETALTRNKTFYLSDSEPDIDFKIEFKRMKKDAIFMCQNFIDLIQEVEAVLKEKWEPKL